MESNNIHGLWIGDTLSVLEQLSIHSFLAHGYSFHLWVYEPVNNIPTGTIVCQADTIISEDAIFAYMHKNKFGHGKGSYAGFSDIFRYKLLYEHGGWWTDMDITCLKPLPSVSDYLFRSNDNKGVVGNIIYCLPKSSLMLYCYDRATNEVTAQNKDWMLPIQILQEGILKFELSTYIKDFCNADNWHIVCKYLAKDKEFDTQWHVFHWMNEEWRRLHISKNSFLKNSTLAILATKYKINYNTLTGRSAMRMKWVTSSINYKIEMLFTSIKWWWNFIFSKSKS